MRLRTAFVPHDLRQPIAGAAGGPLAGFTAAIKDMYDIAGYTTGGGSPEWLATHSPATATCPAVQRLLDAGATIIGKTVCDEFFFSGTGANAHYGTPVNPRAPGRLPGGSSAGSASAAASGVCDFALGSDTGGSVRMPASFCGLYGIRPTHGRVDLTGAMPMAPSFDAAGWLASGPGVFRRVGGVLLDKRSSLSPIENLVILDDAFAEADVDVATLMRAALAAMASDLPKPTYDRAAIEGLEPWRACFRVLQGHEIWKSYGDFVTREKPELGPGIRERMQFASTIAERDATQASDIRGRARERMRSLARPGTLLALPTAPAIAPLVDTPEDALDSFRTRVMRLSCISGLSGLPQVTIPIGSVAGCPAGLSFIAWEGGDEILLDLAVTLSRYCGVVG